MTTNDNPAAGRGPDEVRALVRGMLDDLAARRATAAETAPDGMGEVVMYDPDAMPFVPVHVEEDVPEIEARSAAPEGATPQERAQALVRRELDNGEAAREAERPVVVLEDEVAKYAAAAGSDANLAEEVRANLADALGQWWPQYATEEELGTAAHLAAYGLRPSRTQHAVVPARPVSALITARDARGRLTADSRAVVGLSSQPIPVRVAHHPYGTGEAVRINEALALMGYQPRVPFALAGHRHPAELKVVPVRRDRAIRLARQVAALRCQVAAERTAHQRTLAHLDGTDVPSSAAWLDADGYPLI